MLCLRDSHKIKYPLWRQVLLSVIGKAETAFEKLGDVLEFKLDMLLDDKEVKGVVINDEILEKRAFIHVSKSSKHC